MWCLIGNSGAVPPQNSSRVPQVSLWYRRLLSLQNAGSNPKGRIANGSNSQVYIAPPTLHLSVNRSIGLRSIEKAMLNFGLTTRKKGETGLIGDIQWATPAALKGDPQVIRKLEEAEKLAQGSEKEPFRDRLQTPRSMLLAWVTLLRPKLEDVRVRPHDQAPGAERLALRAKKHRAVGG